MAVAFVIASTVGSGSPFWNLAVHGHFGERDVVLRWHQKALVVHIYVLVHQHSIVVLRIAGSGVLHVQRRVSARGGIRT